MVSWAVPASPRELLPNLQHRRIFAACRPGKPEVVTQGWTSIGLAIEPAPLKLGYNLIDEVIKRPREISGHDIEAISSTFDEPFLQRIGNRCR